MPWKDVTRTREAATAASALKRTTGRVLGVCWRCLPNRFTAVSRFTTCDPHRREQARKQSLRDRRQQEEA